MLLAAVLLPFAYAVLLIVFAKPMGVKVGHFALPLPIALFIFFLSQLPPVLRGEFLSFYHSWAPQMGINLSLSLDGLSLLFALLITGIGIVAIWYSLTYMSVNEKLADFYVFLLLFMGSMLCAFYYLSD